ncbi:RecQ family ATP-dependent DNA helicase [Pedobacter sp. GR22-10]|uniref:RecQ family ATP-dependent DNA helicase n=1 Tax=Pedobacter sp. GR22-10 TaxID=2994472 RepID=UPI0022481A9F|nr:ATP-dependent DNA helicase RecQ [Pedobacter sp. GR22-10]MCX2430001.1 RecQ family ATP-dependent DNA helicase [Pedobacter sp. GR22-10]
MTAIEILQKYWGYPAFRPLQQDIINSVLEGKDSLALLPTGGGKSVCFQVPALVKEGICIVVSPLIALMKDQVENLKSRGIEAIAIYAGMGKREIDILLDNCIYGKIKFLYLSPERLLAELVRVRISYMNVNLIAVDEAHCISQWGYDFRPPYQQIARLREIHPEVPVLALTATATAFVRQDIMDKLEMTDPQVFVKSFARDNLSYVVFNKEDKYKKLLDICTNVKGTGLVYVRNRRETAEVSNFLNRNQVKADFYHAGLERDVRFKKQEDWKLNKTRIMVATNAFGMGIDKADVRTVVHLDLPESLEAYYQEAGRAGRDEKRSYAVLLANQSDILNLESRYIDSFPAPDDIRKTYHYLGSYFQLAFGAGEGLTFTFDIADFCKRFNISVLKTISALKFLEHDGYLTLSESVFLSSRMMFIASHEDIYRFQIENKAYDGIIKTILRSHGGAFDGFISINEADLAKKTGLSYKDIIALLHKLQSLELLTYIQQTDQPQLQYVSPRVDMDHFDLDVKYLELRKEILLKQINAVISYASTNICRSIQLLAYFDEHHASKCGVCDVCLAEKKAENDQLINDEIDFEIISLLQQQAFTLDDLVTAIKKGTENERIDAIRELLDAGKIKTDGKKYYLEA